MNYLNVLNSNQSTAALWNDGPLLVLAGPGSGKTATLTARVARLLEHSQGESFRVLCLTFTRKAAIEMRDRVLKLVPDVRNRALLTTFHSFATDILRQHGNHFGLNPDFEIVEEVERVRLVKALLTKQGDKFPRLLSAEKSLSALDFLFRNVIEDENVPNLVKDTEVGKQLQTLFIAYKTLLKEENSLDYAAILYFCEELLRARPRLVKQLRTVYRFICVDEFQDTNIAQFRLLRALAPERDANVFIVGDDDQVMYQWNGASPERVKELAAHYDLTTIQLPENYRCPPAVVNLANALIQHNGDRSIGKQPLRPMKEDTGDYPIKIEACKDQDAEASWVANNIERQLNEGIFARDIVVLGRNSKLLDRIQLTLTEISILAHVQKRKSQFESAPLRFITSALKLAAVRADDDLVSIVTKALSDCTGEDVSPQLLIGMAGQVNGDHLDALGLLTSGSVKIAAALRAAIADLVKGAFAEFIRSAFAYFDLVESQGNEGMEQFTEYPTERQVWRSIIDELGGESDAYSMSLGQFLQELALANKTPEAPSNAVRCLTIHASKGMEFKHVYLIGLVEDQLPSFQSKKAGDESREMQEERRNCFVAITRTIESLTLTYANQYSGWKKKPSRFLFEMGLLAVGEAE